jgi:hypothetical protein
MWALLEEFPVISSYLISNYSTIEAFDWW